MKRFLWLIVSFLVLSVGVTEADMVDKNLLLIRAAGKGDLPGVKAAIADGADINGAGVNVIKLTARLIIHPKKCIH